MPTTYPIHPGDRLQRRIVSVLTDSLLPLECFSGASITNERDNTEQQPPVIVVRIGESQNQPPNSAVWHVQVTVHLVEDRQEADKVLTGDTRPRHELRCENLSARLFAIWNDATLADEINLISNGQGVYVLKTYGQNVAQTGEMDGLGTEYSFTAICVSTEQ